MTSDSGLNYGIFKYNYPGATNFPAYDEYEYKIPVGENKYIYVNLKV